MRHETVTTPSFQDAPGYLPDDHRVYAIGDIHGCAERLWALHAAIAADIAARPVATPLLVHVGDYVDRGPDSARVVQRLAAGDPLPGVPTVNLMGNHERTMIDALDGAGASATDWMISGGREALASWGGDPDAPRTAWRATCPTPISRSCAGWRYAIRLAATCSCMPASARA